MDIIACDIPSGSLLDPDAIRSAEFRDCYRAPLARSELEITDIFFAVFGHHPLWIKLLLIIRNAVARRAGLDAPTVAEIMRPAARTSYRVGDKIGPWPIFAMSDSEIIAGRNNRHMDFRVSVLRDVDGRAGSVTVSTICNVHNSYGRLYLWCIIPFHRYGVQLLMSRAVAAKRL